MNIFDKSLFMRPGKVMGHALKPFSAYHASSLLLLGSPFMTGGASAWGDYGTFILVCTSDYKTGLDKVLHFQNSRLCRLFWTVWILCFSLSKASAQIEAHIACYNDYPDVAEPIGSKDQKRRCSGAPWPFFVVSLMWQATGTELARLWDMPLNELLCHKAIYDELNGGADIAVSLIEERERNLKQNGDAANG